MTRVKCCRRKRPKIILSSHVFLYCSFLFSHFHLPVTLFPGWFWSGKTHWPFVRSEQVRYFHFSCDFMIFCVWLLLLTAFSSFVLWFDVNKQNNDNNNFISYLVKKIKEQPDKFYLLFPEPECVNVCFWYIPERLRNVPHSPERAAELGRVSKDFSFAITNMFSNWILVKVKWSIILTVIAFLTDHSDSQGTYDELRNPDDQLPASGRHTQLLPKHCLQSRCSVQRHWLPCLRVGSTGKRSLSIDWNQESSNQLISPSFLFGLECSMIIAVWYQYCRVWLDDLIFEKCQSLYQMLIVITILWESSPDPLDLNEGFFLNRKIAFSVKRLESHCPMSLSNISGYRVISFAVLSLLYY